MAAAKTSCQFVQKAAKKIIKTKKQQGKKQAWAAGVWHCGARDKACWRNLASIQRSGRVSVLASFFELFGLTEP